MSVWVCAPSKRNVLDVNAWAMEWRNRGYRVAVARDHGDHGVEVDEEIWLEKYPGYAVAANMLVAVICLRDEDCDWCVVAGDDVLPDPNHTAEEIALQCSSYFAVCDRMKYAHERAGDPAVEASLARASPGILEGALDEQAMRYIAKDQNATFGVMQPTGDRWGIDPNTHAFVSRTQGCNSCACQVCGRGEIAPVHLTGAYIDRVAGSPWIGREFARRIYQGNGPYWPEYTHMGVDEELQAVAIKYGVFWQRPDLTHFHQHWGRPKPGEVIGQAERMPEFLAKANSPGEWKRYKRIFADRQAAGFPGSEPL